MVRYILFVFAIAFGLVIGVFYASEISPVELVDAPPNTLRVDYQTDYVLMVAEIYASDHDAAQAVRYLALLSSAPPDNIVIEALSFALEAGYAPEDLGVMQDLGTALQTWNPALESGN